MIVIARYHTSRQPLSHIHFKRGPQSVRQVPIKMDAIEGDEDLREPSQVLASPGHRFDVRDGVPRAIVQGHDPLQDTVSQL